MRRVHTEIDGLDVLINNTAINPGDAQVAGPDGQPLLDGVRILEVLRVNAVAPLLVAQAFLALLRAGAQQRVVNISSGAVSLALKADGDDYSYAAIDTPTPQGCGILASAAIATIGGLTRPPQAFLTRSVCPTALGIRESRWA